MKQASYKATVLLYSSGIDPFLEDLTKLADRVFSFEERPRDSPKLTGQDLAKDEGSEDAGGVLMAWSRRSDWGIHCDVVNPKLFELEVAKEMLADVYDIQVWEVDGLIGQRLVKSFQLHCFS